MEILQFMHQNIKHNIMEERISNANLSFNCNQDWTAMEQNGDGRFCTNCQKKVYDLTDKKAAYFIQIMQENNNNICGRFTAEQLTPSVQANKSLWRRFAIAAMVFIGFSAAGQKANAQKILIGKPARVIEPDSDKMMMLGIVSVNQIDVELISLRKYLIENCIVPASTNGMLIISFTVKKDGYLTKFALSDHLPIPVREEVLKVIKKAPKWKKPTNESGYDHTLYLTFSNGKILPY